MHLNRSCYESVGLPATPIIPPTVVPLTDCFLPHRVLRKDTVVLELCEPLFHEAPNCYLEPRWRKPWDETMLAFSQTTAL